MVEFAGYEMPLEYTGVMTEHKTVRKSVGLFDVSHMGEIWVSGKQAASYLQRVSSNDIGLLSHGMAQYSCLPNGKGGIVDDLIIHQFDEMKYLLVVNAANIEKDWNWLVSQNTYGVKLENASDMISQLAIQGPMAKQTLQRLTSLDLDAVKPFHFIEGKVGVIDEAIIAATGYTGAGGFELYFHNEKAFPIWDQICNAGEEFDIQPVGLAARDTLRLEMGYCLYGNDIDDTTSSIEAGLGWITRLHESKNLIDREFLMQQKQQGVKRKLVGFEMIDRAIPRHNYDILDSGGRRIGKVTSGTMSPSLNKGIGMGYVETSFSEVGTKICLKIRNKMLQARIVKPPFIN